MTAIAETLGLTLQALRQFRLSMQTTPAWQQIVAGA